MNRPDDLFQFPASFGQEQLWYLHQLAPDSTAYNIAFAFELRGELDESALDRALGALIQRHDALRTGFVVVDEQLRQIVRATVPFRLETEDLSGREETEILALKHQFARHRFDLSQAPLLFVRLLRLAPDRHVLLLCIHHIVVDHQSVLQVGKELGELYQLYAACNGSTMGEGRDVVVDSVDDERLQFPDYVVWQREQMSDDLLARKLEYWNSVLGVKPHTLDLPTDRPRPAMQTFVGDELSVCWPPDLSSALRSHAQREKQSLFVAILTALNVVLHKYCGQRDLIVGCPMANRQAEELQDVVGLFMNVLPVPISVDPEQGFDQLAQHVRRQVTRTQAQQDTPFEKIVRAGDVQHSASHNPLVQVWFTFQDAPLELALPDLDIVSEPLHNGGSKLDISLWYWDDGSQIRGLIEYNTDLFEAATVRRFAEHLAQVLRQVIANPKVRVVDISLLTDSDHAALRALRAESVRADGLASMHEAFFARAAAHPDNVVLTTTAGAVSAGQLAARADAIGAELQRLGVLPGDIVGVCLHRNEDLLASLLGVLRCGAAYLPLDPSLPAERIAYMLDDSAVRIAIVEPMTRNALPNGGITIVMVNTVPVSAHRELVPHAPASADRAYLMYTSGSTGRPKGVQIPHGAVGNFLASMRECPGIGEDDVLLALTTYAFGISVLELFLPLAFGARVWLVERAIADDGTQLGDLIDSGGITVMQATPSTWRLLRESGWEGKAGLKALVGGEALSPELAQWLVPRVGELWNMYGPTETTIWSSCARIDQGNMALCPIGRPIWNTSMDVVDENLRLLPSGIPGELVIGGQGLSLGYLNREELTRERFVRLPETGEPVYRTGDRGLCRDGQLQHLGRSDDQVKIRGFRIELGEIEAVLATMPELEIVAAKAWRIDDVDHRLVAYYCSRSGAPVPVTFLRDHARGFLPAYMIPQHFVHIASMPLLPNGKIDRNALPAALSAPMGGSKTDSVLADAELTPQECLLLAICRELIGSEAVDLDDNFFDAGGHSLLALTLVTRVEKATGTRLKLLKIASNSLRALAYDLGAEKGPPFRGESRIGPRLARWARTAFGSGHGDVIP